MGDERDWRWTMDDGDSSRLFGCTASTPIQTMQTNKQRTEQSLLTVVGAATLSIVLKSWVWEWWERRFMFSHEYGKEVPYVL